MEAEIMESALLLTQENQKQSFQDKLLTIFANEFGADNFDKWLSNLELILQNEAEIILSAPSKFVRDWVIREFVENKKLLKATQKILPKLKKLSVVYVPKEPNIAAENAAKSSGKISNLSKYDNVFAFGTELNPRFTFENFISAKYNKLATSMAKIAAGIDVQINLFNDKIPLFIHGSFGVGKTHLAQAIAWQIKDFDKTKKVVYLSAEKFMYHFVQSLRSNDIMNFKSKMRSIDALIVDDVQFIAGKDSTQQEFMNCFNALVEENKQVVLVCDRCPSNLENIDEKLKSRISGGMIVNFKKPDFVDRLEILKTKASLHNEVFSEDVLHFIADKITSSVRDLEGAIKKLIAAKIFEEREINIESAKTLLKAYFNSTKSKAATIEKIQKAVAEFYEIKLSDLTSSSRLRSFARPRQIAMYLAKKLTQESLPKIGREFGGKNHATVIHSVKLIESLIAKDESLLKAVKSLEEKLSG